MIELQDRAVVLSTRLFSDTDALVTVLTADHGTLAGLVKGGASRKRQADLQPGNFGQIQWRARLEEQLGTLTFEPIYAYANAVLDDRARLTALQAFAALALPSLSEREPVPGLFQALETWLEHLDQDFWPLLYVKLELGLLATLGFSIDLERCALGGDVTQLSHVSPKTGRAVSAALAQPYVDRLLPLPRFLGGVQDLGAGEVAAGLRLTGTLLARHVFAPVNRDLPELRHHLAKLL